MKDSARHFKVMVTEHIRNSDWETFPIGPPKGFVYFADAVSKAQQFYKENAAISHSISVVEYHQGEKVKSWCVYPQQESQAVWSRFNQDEAF